jgi:adenosylcobinamide-phosphate synthase
MSHLLSAVDLPGARRRLGHLCARDASALGAAELTRATVESLAENTSDAVVAPLFWGAIAGVPGLLAYRAVNTLDAMVGYRSPRYARFGWAAARLDDVANLVPARLSAAFTAGLAPVVGGSVAATARVIRRDGRQHPSPNAGLCEAAFAGALDVRLGGTNQYDSAVETRPLLGDGRTPELGDIARAARLSRAVGAAAAVSAVSAVVIARLGRRR